MKIRIVVDSNIIISALLGGKPRFILFDLKFECITIQKTLEEVEKCIPLISENFDFVKVFLYEKSGISPNFL